MNRDFKRFLEAYCRELAGIQTSNIKKLAALAAVERPRLREPLFLFCLSRGKASYLLSVVPDESVRLEYEEMAARLERFSSIEECLASKALPKRYTQVLDAFYAQGSDVLNSDRRIASLLRPKILAALAEKGITRYAMCRDLGLNMGNVYTYLSGDSTKVSLDTARSMLAYATSR